MTKYEVVATTAEHVAELAETMRQADKDEVWAIARLKPGAALLSSVMASRDPMTGLVNGKVACIFGYGATTLLSDRARPWLLGSDLLPKHARAFLRRSRQYVEKLFTEFEILENYVDARNTEAVKWLKWLGFTMEPAQLLGPDKTPFHRFYWRRPNV